MLPSAGFFPPTLPPEVDPRENEVVLGSVSDVKVVVEFVTPLVSVVEGCDKSGDMISVQLYAGQACIEILKERVCVTIKDKTESSVS